MSRFCTSKNKRVKWEETPVQHNEESSNGLLVQERYIPEELLSRIFCYLDHKTLLSCQLVCKQWRFLIQDFVWHKKAEQSTGKAIPVDKTIPWPLYYFTCAKLPFGKNLMKNHSGELGVDAHWTVVATAGNGWGVENPPLGVLSLPEDPVFEGKQHCFVTSYYTEYSPRMGNYSCRKYQIVDLLEMGFTKYLLDYIQPKITVYKFFDCSVIILFKK